MGNTMKWIIRKFQAKRLQQFFWPTPAVCSFSGDWHILNVLTLGALECFYCILACFVYGVKQCIHVSSPFTLGAKNSFPSLSSRRYGESDLEAQIFLCASVTNPGANCHTLCGVHILKGHCCVQFRIQCCDSSVFPNQFLSPSCFHIPPYVLGRLMWWSAWVFYNFLIVCTIFWHAAHPLRHDHTPL
jgi:hypothetical protein